MPCFPRSPGTTPSGRRSGAAFEDRDEDELSPAKIAAALAAFDALPEHTRRQLLNGWSPSRRPSRGEWQHYERLILTPMISADYDRPMSAHKVFGEAQPTGNALVEVKVREGAKRDDVLAALANIAPHLHAHWDALINAEATF